MTFGQKEDGTAVLGMIATSEAAFVVTQKAIYRVELADQIDPNRTNINIPNTQQLFSAAGADSDIVARTLLTTSELFTKSHFPDIKIRDRIVSISAEVMTELLAAEEILSQLEAAEKGQIEEIAASKDLTRLPAIPNIKTRSNTFIQKSEHALQAIYRLPAVFYESEMKAAGRWPDSLTEALTAKFGENDVMASFARQLAEFAHQVRNTRHCVEHHKPDQRIVARDFHFNLDGAIARPTIQVIHPKTPIDETDLARISHQKKCIGPENLRNCFCNKELSDSGTGSDADTLYFRAA
ncbi:hypothetical protein [Mesorhizobium sp. B1-1-8]|uniref:hypothetical protein n=1 Tax=Mesorhizobium sp. B1-1-8 TaxID=2589976 RepID=UPI001D02EE25|nr:hypothetical protein [Mesorhizobium sp. B1-1-8]UCI06015.1 hypothetical protein FJ974_19575 [Mesorhizobium sp. B1-1-8]